MHCTKGNPWNLAITCIILFDSPPNGKYNLKKMTPVFQGVKEKITERLCFLFPPSKKGTNTPCQPGTTAHLCQQKTNISKGIMHKPLLGKIRSCHGIFLFFQTWKKTQKLCTDTLEFISINTSYAHGIAPESKWEVWDIRLTVPRVSFELTMLDGNAYMVIFQPAMGATKKKPHYFSWNAGCLMTGSLFHGLL